MADASLAPEWRPGVPYAYRRLLTLAEEGRPAVKIRALVPVALCGVLAWGCASTPQGAGDAVRIVGSDTMLELNRRFAESFMRGHPGVPILVDGGGSGAGIEALIAGTTSIAAASRPLSSAEVARLYEVHQTLGVRFLVAQDALSIFLNAANPVRNLSLEQLRGLFAGTSRTGARLGAAPARCRSSSGPRVQGPTGSSGITCWPAGHTRPPR